MNCSLAPICVGISLCKSATSKGFGLGGVGGGGKVGGRKSAANGGGGVRFVKGLVTAVHSDNTANVALDYAQLAVRVPFRRIQVREQPFSTAAAQHHPTPPTTTIRCSTRW